MPAPAGTGLTRRSFLSRSAGMAMAVYGASRLGWDAFEEGIAAAAERPAEPVLVSVFLDGGADSLSILAPTGPLALRAAAARTSRSAAGEGTAFSEDTSLRWHPSPHRSPRCTARARSPSSRRSATPTPNQSHFTSRHFWEVGETNPNARLGWMGRYLDRHGTNDNPLQGLSLGWDLAPALASAKRPRRGGERSRRLRLLGPQRVGPGGGRDDRARSARSAAAPPATRRCARRATPPPPPGRLRTQLLPFQDGYSTPGGRRPTRPARTSRAAWRAWPR